MQDGTPKQAKLPPDVVATITALREQRTELSDAVISWRAAYLIRDADAKNLEKAVGDKVRELEAAREEIKKLQFGKFDAGKAISDSVGPATSH